MFYKFLKFFKFDLINSFRMLWKRLLLLIAIIMCSNLFFYFKIIDEAAYNDEMSLNKTNFGDYVLNCFAGIKEYIFDPKNPFIFPALWLLSLLLISYTVLHFPYENLMGIGKNMLTLSKSRNVWWISKFCWLIVSISFIFFIIYSIIFLFTFFTGSKLSLEINSQTPFLLSFDIGKLKTNYESWNILPAMILVPMVVLSVCALQMTLTLVIRPQFAYLFTMSFLLFSSYYQNRWIHGNYAMLARSSMFINDGMRFKIGIIYSLAVIILSFISGLFIFKNKDIIERG